MNIQEILKALMIAAYDTGYYTGKGEDGEIPHQQALTRRIALKKQLEMYLTNKEDFHVEPHVEIILQIDIRSFLTHCLDQDGTSEEMAQYLRWALMRLINKGNLRFDLLAQEIMLHQEVSNLSMNVKLQDNYPEWEEEETKCEE